jgi:hypothetical protein
MPVESAAHALGLQERHLNFAPPRTVLGGDLYDVRAQTRDLVDCQLGQREDVLRVHRRGCHAPTGNAPPPALAGDGTAMQMPSRRETLSLNPPRWTVILSGGERRMTS